MDDTNLAESSGSFLESQKNYDPRIVSFYFVLATLLLTLVVGLAYRQLSKTVEHALAERKQNQRRVLLPAPRGNIYDRNGKLLVGNNARFAVLLHLNELKPELDREFRRIRNNYRAADDADIPSYRGLQQITRVTVAQRYLDQVNRVLHRDEKINSSELHRHFERQLLLPYKLLDNLGPIEFARVIENLPVRSPLEVYASTVRSYPFGAAAAHTLGYVRPDTEIDTEGLPGKDLTTFKLPGIGGQDGLEKSFDLHLRGEPGTKIYLVDPLGYKINDPLESRAPKQGKHLIASLDIDLQIAAEEAIGDQRGAAVAIDVATGEVLLIASKPSYDLSTFSPRATREVVAEMNERGAWPNLAMNGFYPPGSTFKILTTIAGLRRGVIDPEHPIAFCNGQIMVGNRSYRCDVGNGHHGNVLLRDAIAQSCDIYYYKAGELMTPEVIAAEGRRFRLNQKTGIELPNEQGRMIMPDPEWKRLERGERWVPGDTAHISIGQGDILVSPLQMACFTASFARDEVFTQPTLIHDPGREPRHFEKIGLSPLQRGAIIDGMVGSVTRGSGSILNARDMKIPGIRLAGKTGTAQLRVMKQGKLGMINLAWFICFAPVEKPEIAVAVMIEGETLGEDFYGGRNAGPVVAAVLKKYFEKGKPAANALPPYKSE